MAHLGLCVTMKQHRVFRYGPASLPGMGQVIDSDTNDFAGVGNQG